MESEWGDLDVRKLAFGFLFKPRIARYWKAEIEPACHGNMNAAFAINGFLRGINQGVHSTCL